MYSHVSLNKLQLNITSPEEKELRLNKGEIIKGQVKDVKDNGLILIYLKGRLIEALSEVMVKPGDMLYLMVDDFKDKKAYLKVLTPENLSKLENNALSLQLREIGIVPREQEVLIAKKLIQHNLPLTPENIKKLSQGVKILGEFNAKNLEIAAFALAKGIPLNKEILGLIAYHVDKDADLAKWADNVLRFANEYLKKPSAQIVIPPDKAGEKGIIDPSGAKEGILKPEGSLKEEGLNQSLRNIKADDNLLKGAVAASIFKEGDTADIKVDQSKLVQPANREISFLSDLKITERMHLMLKALKSVLEEMRLNPAVLKDNNILGDRLKQALEAEKDFIQVLSKILEVVKQEEGLEKSRIGSEFLRSLENIEKGLSGQRLFNFISRNSSDNNFNYYYFALPVELGNNTHLLEMRIDKDKRHKNMRDSDCLSMAVALDTPRMGKVIFHVNWTRGYKIELRGVVETPPVQVYIEKNVNELVLALAGLGYKVDYLGIKVAENKEEIILDQIKLVKAEENVRPFGIDVIV